MDIKGGVGRKKRKKKEQKKRGREVRGGRRKERKRQEEGRVEQLPNPSTFRSKLNGLLQEIIFLMLT